MGSLYAAPDRDRGKPVTLSQQAVRALLPDRKADAHKGNFGKLLLLCGSRGYTGAAYLSAMGALRSGAGLVFLEVPECIYAIEATKLNEAIVFPLPDQDGTISAAAIPEIAKRLPEMDAVLLGCGLGLSKGSEAMVCWALSNVQCPLVLDADGITLAAQHMDLLRGRTGITILTPHAGEFARLGFSAQGQQEAAEQAARELGCIIVLKGHRTCITDGTRTYINPTGNPGMAVGGSGDVLAGIITALLGQRLPPLEAAACGCWVHGAAGDVCAKRLGQYGMLPTDMLEVLPRLLK